MVVVLVAAESLAVVAGGKSNVSDRNALSLLLFINNMQNTIRFVAENSTKMSNTVVFIRDKILIINKGMTNNYLII